VLAWDIWNEPDNTNGSSYGSLEPKKKVEIVVALLPHAFAWARSSKPEQPLTSGIWHEDPNTPEKLSPMAKEQLELSDVISFHNYSPPAKFEQEVKWLEKYGRPSHPRELADHLVMIYTGIANPEIWRLHHPQQGEYAVPLHGRIRSNNGDVFLASVCAGHGIALLPEFIVWRALAEGKIVAILPEWSPPPIALNLVTPPNTLRPARVRVLIDYLAKRFAKVPWALDS